MFIASNSRTASRQRASLCCTRKRKARSNAKHHHGMAVEAVAEAPPTGQFEIFAHGQRADVADAAPFQIARAGVMDGVAASPMVLGCQGHHADGAPYPVVRPPITEERTVAAVVLDHEQPHEEARCRHSNGQAQPIAQTETWPHQGPEQNERHRADEDLHHAANVIRLPIPT